jgi:hypothetical protein
LHMLLLLQLGLPCLDSRQETYLPYNKKQIYEQRIRWDNNGFLEDVFKIVIVFTWRWPVGAETCCDTKRYNNINNISQLRLRVYVWKIFT